MHIYTYVMNLLKYWFYHKSIKKFISITYVIFRLSKVVKNEVGDVDILVNNAGVLFNTRFMSLTEEMISTTFDVNIMSHFWVSFCTLITYSIEGNIIFGFLSFMFLLNWEPGIIYGLYFGNLWFKLIFKFISANLFGCTKLCQRKVCTIPSNRYFLVFLKSWS